MPTKTEEQLQQDIAFCIDECEMNDEQIGEMLRATESLGNISVEYFCEEFIFTCVDDEGNEDLDALNRVHDDSYLPIIWRLDNNDV